MFYDDAMLEQPPPGPERVEEERPEGVSGGTSKGSFIAMCVVGGLAVLGCLLVLAAPMVIRAPRAVERTMAISNAKQVGLALLEFDQEYGSFPSDATIAEVVRTTGSTLDFTDGSSNAMFRQLIAYGVPSEEIFYCSHPDGTRKPDNLMSPGYALASGEVGYSYVYGLSSSMDRDTPVLMSPVVAGTDDEFWADQKGRGSPKAFDGKAIILHVDNSVEALIIRPSDRKATVGGGVTVLDPSRPCFGGKKPDVRHPKF